MAQWMGGKGRVDTLDNKQGDDWGIIMIFTVNFVVATINFYSFIFVLTQEGYV